MVLVCLITPDIFRKACDIFGLSNVTLTTSDRTITNGAPRLTTIRSVDYEEPQLNTASNADKVAAYMAKQTGIEVASNEVDLSVLR